MAVVNIPHKPQLTKEQSQELFRKHFEGKYQVEDFKGLFRDFMVVKSPFIGVALKLEQTERETKFVYSGVAPRWWARVLLGALVVALFSGAVAKDVKEYLETAPEFK